MFGWLAMRCDGARADLVAWVDGALPTRRARQLARHLDACQQCASEGASVRASARQQQTLLRSLTGAETVDVDDLWRRMRLRLAAEPEPARRSLSLRWLWRPALAFAVTLAVVWGGVTTLGDHDALLISTGVKSPPKKLEEKPDLFKEYAVIEELEVLERFHTADTDTILAPVTPEANQG